MPGYDLLSRTLTVSEANEIIHDTVESLFYELSIEGEISGFRPASSGHWYFTLKDKSAALDAAVFRSAQFQMVMPEDGDLVIAKGSLSFYTKTGKLTFVIREMKRKGEGDLLKIIEKRKEYYRSLGYFDDDKKKPIPEEITKLGVVTSPTGAAIRDILNITRRRAPSLDIIIFPCAVQGDGAAESIAMRIRQANSFLACDVLIVGRGGGSVEDLSCFSEPCVIEAIHDSEIPVISAVGMKVPGKDAVVFSDEASVIFLPLSDNDIESYLDTEEWIGAAGAYRLQKTGYKLVERIDGDWTTVVGLPLKKILDYLYEL